VFKSQDFYWVWKVVSSFCLAFACIQMSTCIAHWLIIDTSFVCVYTIATYRIIIIWFVYFFHLSAEGQWSRCS